MSLNVLATHVINFNVHFIGNATSGGDDFDYYATYTYPYFATVERGSTEFELKIPIVDDDILEDHDLIRITALAPDYPDGKVPCSTDLIIRDDDGKCLCEIVCNWHTLSLAK